MNIYEACPEVENGSFLLYIPHINDRLADYFTLDGMRSDAVHGKGSPV